MSETPTVAKKISLKVNGQAQTIQVDDPAMPLLYALRDDLGLHGPCAPHRLFERLAYGARC